MRGLWRVFLVAWCVTFAVAPALGLAATTQEVEEALTCQCGCGLTVHSCNHLQCGFAVPAKKTIAELIAQGQGTEEITASFVSRYGEKVLSAPTTKGFNLAAWITPFAVLLAGGALVTLVSLRWARRSRSEEAEPLPDSPVTDAYRDRLKKELDSFEG
jgi:cytochrome c-type biogenesis protein CcmH